MFVAAFWHFLQKIICEGSELQLKRGYEEHDGGKRDEHVGAVLNLEPQLVLDEKFENISQQTIWKNTPAKFGNMVSKIGFPKAKSFPIIGAVVNLVGVKTSAGGAEVVEDTRRAVHA